MHDVAIRPYELRDREAVFRVAADTAFFGEALERYLDDRRLFCDGFYRYYTDLEPQHGWVACANDEVVGFLMGCVETSVQRRRWVKEIFPAVAVGVLRGDYKIGALTWRHALRVARTALFARPRVDTAKYPAHLHLNVCAPWRRQGLGRRLLEASLSQLRELGIPGVHANTTSLNGAAGRLYERMGFRAVDTCTSARWSGFTSGTVVKVSYVLEL